LLARRSINFGKLSPLPSPMRFSPRPAHRSEIMTSGWCGGGWVARESFRARPKVPRHGPVRWPSRCKRVACPMQGAPGSKAAMHKAAGEGGQCRVARVARPPTLFAMRHGMLPGRGTISPKPRSAGEARASYNLRTNRVGAHASPARFTAHQPEAATPAGVSSRPVHPWCQHRKSGCPLAPCALG
jgi:hypothetical protein